MKNNDLLKKIGKYSMAAGATVLAGNLANANVVVTTDNTNLADGTYNIDFDGNGLPDARININLSTFTWSTFSSTSYRYGQASIIAGSDVSSMKFMKNGLYGPDNDGPAALPAGLLVSSSLSSSTNWGSANHLFATYSGWSYNGNFSDISGQTRYIGVRFVKSGETYYGYIGINVGSLGFTSHGTFGTLANYGYETTPDTQITTAAEATEATPTPAVPLSPLATGLGIGLIGLYGFYKTRRKLNVEN